MPLIHAPEFPDGLVWLNVDRPLRLREELRGQVVVLDFWTYCCINCMHVIPELAHLEEKYRHDPVVFLGVHSNKYDNEAHPENVAQAILRYGVTHPVVVDDEHLIWGMYGVSAWPTLVVIDSAGYVIAVWSGEGHGEELDRLIAGLLELGRQNNTLAAEPIVTQPLRVAETDSRLLFPGKVLADPVGRRLFIADSGHHHILITDYDGKLQGFLGSGVPGLVDGSYEDARFRNPQGMALFGNTLYIADTDNHAVRQADLASFHVHTTAGNGMIGYDRRGGHHGRNQVLNSPWDVTFLNGLLYIALAGLHQIWSYDPQTQAAEVKVGTGRENITDDTARKSALAQTSGLSAANGKLYFADSETSAIRVYDPDAGTVRTLVGKGLFVFGDVDGPADDALLQHPLGVEASGSDLFVADSYNHKIRRIDLKTGQVSTVAGEGVPGTERDGRLLLYEPGGLSVADQDLFIADTNNHRIIRYRLDTGAWSEVRPILGR
ncbi:MAG: thioredoxin-like domain-containing protein [Armatimonadota bacterium]